MLVLSRLPFNAVAFRFLMAEHASDFDSLISIIKTEPEEFQQDDQNVYQSPNDVLLSEANKWVWRAKNDIKIFYDPLSALQIPPCFRKTEAAQLKFSQEEATMDFELRTLIHAASAKKFYHASYHFVIIWRPFTARHKSCSALFVRSSTSANPAWFSTWQVFTAAKISSVTSVTTRLQTKAILGDINRFMSQKSNARSAAN